ncbi:hypothetical protein MICAC_4610020 [Microcystis aeruginosa PCC 9443]|uniref:Uncharacterized protein n=1 Tax=Microcystis aeruginosa PCC 9443 TaxID=1160281 RepID=I4G6B7_MICAE|nr:hypothetical protein MICAC_4610020 [Microcystis aeruginosa PCC 9443]
MSLTEKQKNLLRWIVKGVRAGYFPAEDNILWGCQVFGGPGQITRVLIAVLRSNP